MSKKTSISSHSPASPDEPIKCGVIMPISSIDNCASTHWAEVFEIIKESLEGTNFFADIVSSSADTAIIHKTILKNLYENEIIICDVSARNPNVMLELGMRLAFDKPVVVIKDDATPYNFDTSPIQHLEYPRDLRFSKIKAFKDELRKKVIATHKVAGENSSFFLKEYPLYKSANLPEEQVGPWQAVLDQISDLNEKLNRQNTRILQDKRGTIIVPVPVMFADEIAEQFREENRTVTVYKRDKDKMLLFVGLLDGENANPTLQRLKQFADEFIPF